MTRQDYTDLHDLRMTRLEQELEKAEADLDELVWQKAELESAIQRIKRSIDEETSIYYDMTHCQGEEI